MMSPHCSGQRDIIRLFKMARMGYRYQIYDPRSDPRETPSKGILALVSRRRHILVATRANLLARRKSRNGADIVARVRAGSQDVQRRIILRMEDHPITVQVTRASFVFISPFRLALPLRANLCPSSSSSPSSPSPSSRKISYAVFSVRQHPGEKREIIRTSVKQRLSRIFVRAFSRDYPAHAVSKQLI